MAGEVTSPPTSKASPEVLTSPKPRLSRTSPSFRLRSQSLNSIRLRRVFDLFDHNGDGVITADEICLALTCLGLEVDNSELCADIKSYIPPGHLGLDFDAFNSLHRALGDALFDAAGGVGRELQEEEEMREAFMVFDEDGDGFISAKELQVVLAKLGLAEGQAIHRVELMIGSVDQNHDGRVDFFEFKSMMKMVDVPNA